MPALAPGPPVGDQGDGRQIIQEWSVHPTRKHLPSVDVLLDRLVEDVCDALGEDSLDDLERVAAHADVQAAAEALLAVFAARVKWSQADRLVAEHTVTWGADGQPLVDGDPLYRPTQNGES